MSVPARKYWPTLYPFLFALYPVLFLYVQNMDQVPLRDILRALVAVLLGTGLLMLLAGSITRSASRAAMFSAWVMLLFSSFGHVYQALDGRSVLGVPLGYANVLAAAWAAMLILIGWAILRLVRSPEAWNRPLNAFAVILVMQLLLQAGSYIARTASAHPVSAYVAMQEEPLLAWRGEGKRPPDIYYIILDQYGRTDVLAEMLGVDNSDFIAALEDRGFYVAGASYSNYPHTILSLASSLNSDYLFYLHYKPFSERGINQKLTEKIHYNQTKEQLARLGYRSYAFTTGYYFTETGDVDVFIPVKHSFNNFEILYLESSAAFINHEWIYADRTRETILLPLDEMPKIAGQDIAIPKYVFVHIPAAHEPFVFTALGDPVYLWRYALSIRTGQYTYQEVYTGQMQYFNRLLLKTIDGVLENSPVPPVIILQGDHGPPLRMDWNNLDKACLRGRYSILNAYLVPPEVEKKLYPLITPVNSFRVLFDGLFGAELGLLEDRAFYVMEHEDSYYVDITDRVDTCAGWDQ
jgi:hypothetical protein